MAGALVAAGREHHVPKSYYLRGGAGERTVAYESFITATPRKILEVNYSSRKVVNHQLHACGPFYSHQSHRAAMTLVLNGEKAGTAVLTVGHGRHLAGHPSRVGSMVQLKRQ